eukprot:m.337151 g.337151  ORF g.337151 m.337151 type:complete len:115 (-) comp19802_c0_seq1:211-555(-)
MLEDGQGDAPSPTLSPYAFSRLMAQFFSAKEFLARFLHVFERATPENYQAAVDALRHDDDDADAEAPEMEPPAPEVAQALIPCENCGEMLDGFDMFIMHMMEEHPDQAARLQLF